MPPSSEKYNLIDAEGYRQYEVYKSYMFYKKVLRNLFEKDNDDKYGHFYIEAGALDGQFQSNTLYLEQDLHWNGLLLEPDDREFQNLLAKHRKAWSANICIAQYPFSYKVSKIVCLFCDDYNRCKIMLNGPIQKFTFENSGLTMAFKC